MRRALTPCLEGNIGQWPRADGCEPHSQQEGASGASGCESRKLLPLVCLLPSTLCPADTTALSTHLWKLLVRTTFPRETIHQVSKCAGAQAIHSSPSAVCSQLGRCKGAGRSSPQSLLSTSCLQSPAGKEQSWLCDIALGCVKDLLYCWHLTPSWKSMYAMKGLYAMVELVPLQSCAELFKDLACYVTYVISLCRDMCASSLTWLHNNPKAMIRN